MTDIQQPGRVWSGTTPPPDEVARYRDLVKRLVAERPPFFRAVARDAIVFAYHRGEMDKCRTKLGRALYALRLPFFASEYFALVLYRLRVLLRTWHVLVIPSLLNYVCAIGWGIRIGNPVVIKEGVYIPHGEMVIDGNAFISKGCVLCPSITIGLVQGELGAPYLEEGVFVGTGARVLGGIRIGYGTRIGANAVVLSDVPAWATAVGVPARTILNPNAPRPQASTGAAGIDNEEPPCAPSGGGRLC
jgi:serine O-acetyltransferase